MMQQWASTIISSPSTLPYPTLSSPLSILPFPPFPSPPLPQPLPSLHSFPGTLELRGKIKANEEKTSRKRPAGESGDTVVAGGTNGTVPPTLDLFRARQQKRANLGSNWLQQLNKSSMYSISYG